VAPERDGEEGEGEREDLSHTEADLDLRIPPKIPQKRSIHSLNASR
jgi:hypothetical protein